MFCSDAIWSFKSRFCIFALISDIPVPYLTHIDVVDAGLEVLESGQIKSATVESLRFMNNKIKIIDDNLFG